MIEDILEKGCGKLFIVPRNDWCAERDRSAKVQKAESTLNLDKNLCLIPGLREKRALPIKYCKEVPDYN